MTYCNGCLKENVDGFCPACESKLFNRATVPVRLGFNWDDIEKKNQGYPTGFSISGVQPKGFIGRNKNKLLGPNIHIESMYIVKPFLDSRKALYTDSPANEHLTMTIADQLFNIPAAKCAFMYFANGEPVYLTRRFDRDKNGNPLRQEDFTSVLNIDNSGINKYNSATYEDVGRRCSPIDRIRLIKILLFNFLTGNGDVHLKNLSLLESADGDMLLSPSYDLMNTKLHINDPQMAMNLFKEMERTREHLFSNAYDYKIGDFIELGKRLDVKVRIINAITDEFTAAKNAVLSFVDRSFLSEAGKQKYKDIVEKHYDQLFAT